MTAADVLRFPGPVPERPTRVRYRRSCARGGVVARTTWRADEALLRRRTARAGSVPVASRGPQESFEPVMDRALRLHGPAVLARMLDLPGMCGPVRVTR